MRHVDTVHPQAFGEGLHALYTTIQNDVVPRVTAKSTGFVAPRISFVKPCSQEHVILCCHIRYSTASACVNVGVRVCLYARMPSTGVHSPWLCCARGLGIGAGLAVLANVHVTVIRMCSDSPQENVMSWHASQQNLVNHV